MDNMPYDSTPWPPFHFPCKCNMGPTNNASALLLARIEAKAHELFHQMPSDLVDHIAMVIPTEIYERQFGRENKVVIHMGNGHLMPLVPGHYAEQDECFAAINVDGVVVAYI